MAGVMPYVCKVDGALADVIAIWYVIDSKTTEVDIITSYWAKWQMLLPTSATLLNKFSINWWTMSVGVSSNFYGHHDQIDQNHGRCYAICL